MRGLLQRDLANASANLRAWRAEGAKKDTPFARDRIAYWLGEADRLLDLWNGGSDVGPSHL